MRPAVPAVLAMLAGPATLAVLVALVALVAGTTSPAAAPATSATPSPASPPSSSPASSPTPSHASPPSRATATPTPTTAASGRAICIDDSAPYDPSVLRERVAHLASPELDGRAAGSPGDLAARAYIAERFRCLGLTPGGDGGAYEQPFTSDGRATANLIGYVRGSDERVARDIIVVGAHHDHLGDRRLGANDNASGVVALLAIAQAIRQRPAPRRTIAFVAFGGEELGLLGSRHFTAHPPAALPLDRVVHDVNLDMVGSYASTGAVHAMGTFRDLPGTAIVNALARDRPELRIRTGGRGVGSDHEPFCRAGIPYVFFWTPDRQCYHARCDTAEQLDAVHLGEIAAFAGELVARLADTTDDLARARARLGCGAR
jgi:aminopeptidase YwaD